MIPVSQAIKNSCKADKNTYREFIIINQQTIEIKGKLSATAYKDTTFIGTFNMKVLEFETENTTQFKNQEFQYYKEIDGRLISLGKFITTDIVDNDSTGMVKVTAYDYALKFSIPYVSELNYSSGTITLYQVLQECCTKAGVELYNGSITNGNFIVDSNQFVNGELIGDVVSAIAGISCSFATINYRNQLNLLLSFDTDEILEDYSDLDDKRDTQPITSVAIGFSQIEGEDVIRQDQSLIQQYGEHWLRIYDNPFAYSTEKFPLLIDAIFNKIKGFRYSSFKSEYTFKPYLTLGDKIKFRNKNGDLIDSIILRYEYDYDDCTFEAPSITNSSVEYQKTASAEDLLKRAEIRIDKELNEVDIRGKTINLTADTIGITSTNFSVDTDGNINAKGGKIAGYNITDNELYAEMYAKKSYDTTDLNKVRDYIMGTGTLTDAEKELYDINGDGDVTPLDYTIMKNLIQYGITNTNPLRIIMSTGQNMFDSAFKITDGNNNELVKLDMTGLWIDDIQYKPFKHNDYFEIGSSTFQDDAYIINGYITNGGKEIRASIPLPQPISSNVSSVVPLSIIVQIRGRNGYVENSNFNDYTSIASANIVGNTINLVLTNSVDFGNYYGNSPVSLVGYFKFMFD